MSIKKHNHVYINIINPQSSIDLLPYRILPWSKVLDKVVVIMLVFDVLGLFGFTDMEKAAAMADIISVLFDI